MRGERGQTLVLVALILVALMAMIALAIDGGNAYLERRQMQTAADAGALAAARARCLGSASWQTVGQTLCEANSSQSSISCDVGPGNGAGSAWATAEETLDTWFAGIVGVPSLTVGARAVANCEPITGTGTLLPLTIDDSVYSTGSTYTIWDKDYGESGSYGWLRWDGADEMCGNPTTLSRCIQEPSCAPYVGLGQIVDAEPGVNDSGLVDLWNAWHCQVVVIPLYGYFDEHNKTYQITNFGAFRVTGMCDGKNHSAHCPGASAPVCAGGDKKVTGQFTYYVNPDSTGGGAESSVYVVYLAD